MKILFVLSIVVCAELPFADTEAQILGWRTPGAGQSPMVVTTPTVIALDGWRYGEIRLKRPQSCYWIDANGNGSFSLAEDVALTSEGLWIKGSLVMGALGIEVGDGVSTFTHTTSQLFMTSGSLTKVEVVDNGTSAVIIRIGLTQEAETSITLGVSIGDLASSLAVYLRRDGGNSPTAAIDWGAQDLTDVNLFEAETIRSNGHIYVNYDGPDTGVGSVYFYEDGSPTGERLYFDNSWDAFRFTDAVYAEGYFISTDGVMAAAYYPYWSGGDYLKFGNYAQASMLYIDGATKEARFYGTARYSNYGGADADQFLYFYEDGSATGESFKWDDGDDRFELSDDLYLTQGEIIGYATDAELLANRMAHVGVGDGSTTVAETRKLRFDPTWLSVTDEGSSSVLVEFAGLAGTYTTTDTIVARYTIYHGVLAAVGRFNVAIPQTYDHLEIKLVARSDVSATVDHVAIQLNADSTATNYRRTAHYGGSAHGAGASNDSIVATVPGASSQTGDFGAANITIHDYRSTSRNKDIVSLGTERQDATDMYSRFYTINWESTNAITSVTLQPDGWSTDQFATGTAVWIYGVKEIDVITGIAVGGMDGITTANADLRYLKLDASNDPITASLGIDGNLSLNQLGPDADAYLYFYEDASETGESLKWDNANDRFVFSDEVLALKFMVETSDCYLTRGGGGVLEYHSSNATYAHRFYANAVTPATIALFDNAPSYVYITGTGNVRCTGIFDNDGTGDNDFEGTLLLGGSYIKLNDDGPDGDSFLYFYEDSSATGEYLKWDNADDRFEMADDLFLDGGALVAQTVSSHIDVYVNFDGADGNSFLYFYEDSSATGEYLAWNDSEDYFVLSDDLRVTGNVRTANLTVAERFLAAESGIPTLPVNDTTPDLSTNASVAYYTANTIATTITNFDNPVHAQIIIIIAGDSNTTIADNSNIILAGSANWTMGTDDTLTLLYTTGGSAWYEISRSDN